MSIPLNSNCPRLPLEVSQNFLYTAPFFSSFEVPLIIAGVSNLLQVKLAKRLPKEFLLIHGCHFYHRDCEFAVSARKKKSIEFILFLLFLLSFRSHSDTGVSFSYLKMMQNFVGDKFLVV